MRTPRIWILAALIAALLLGAVAVAQPIEPTGENPADPNANITWPPPVYLLSGSFDIRGSANLANMQLYFIEVRQLNDDGTPLDEEIDWLPVTLPSRAPVLDDVLGTWDTSVEPDGLYEMRLVIETGAGQPVIFRVAPLRIENEPPPFAVTPTPDGAGLPLPTVPALPTQPPAQPTLQPTPTQFDPTPQLTVGVSANVREGDSTDYNIIGSLQPGQVARILGVSNRGTGWYYIELPNGIRGWIAGGIARVTGNLAGLPRIEPPPPPFTPTPLPSPTPDLPDAAILGIRYDRGEIRQGEAFQVIVRVRNNNAVTLPDVPVLCTFKPMNQEVSALVGALGGFQEREIFMPVTLNSGGGANVQVDCAVDVNNVVAETNVQNNFFSITTPLLAP